jgi:hypothetical protein
MGGVHEKHSTLSSLGFSQRRFDLVLEIGRLFVWVSFSWDHPHFAATQMEFFKTRLGRLLGKTEG